MKKIGKLLNETKKSQNLIKIIKNFKKVLRNQKNVGQMGFEPASPRMRFERSGPIFLNFLRLFQSFL